jgi:Domain of unknown function (DUF4397)
MRGKLFRIFPFAAALICLGSVFLTVGCGSSSARYRYIQAATAVPTNVDLQVDGKTVQTAVGYGQPATYHSSSSGSRKFVIFPTGTTTNPYISASVSLGSHDTTVISEGPFASIALAPYTDDNTAPTTGNVKVRIIQASPTAAAPPQGIDVYVVPTGQGIGGVNPQFTNLAYPNASPTYLSLAAGSYDVIMTVTGTQNILNSLTGTYTLTSGQIRTIVVLDASFGGGPYQQLLLNDLN